MVVTSCVVGGLACELGFEAENAHRAWCVRKILEEIAVPDCSAESSGEMDCITPSVPEEAVQVGHGV